MRISKALLFLGLAAFAVGMTSCTDKSKDNDKPVVNEQVPTTYNFENVNYKGQTVRILLTDTLMEVIEGLEETGATPVTKAQLEQIYDNANSYYANIATGKKLSDKIFGGAGGEMDKQMRAWFDTLATRSAKFAGSEDAVTTANGIYLPEFIEKNLMGGVFYYQALKYLNEEVPVADNNTVNAGEGTAMQHNWDEAFGYFGAAKEYNKFSDEEISANPSQKDVNGDGKIDITTEKNYFFGRYAGSRDKNYTRFTATPTDYTKDIYDAFLKGRYNIGKKDYAKRDEAANTIKATWDKIVASSAINYAVAVKNNMSNPEMVRGRWAELKTFVDMTQYNSSNKLGTANYNKVKNLMGETSAGITVEKLDEIINTIKSAYGF